MKTMYFQRCYRLRGRPITPQRLAAAKRAVQRDHDSVPLFPEMIRHATPEERIHAHDREFAIHFQRIRDSHAKTWRATRAELRSLPPAQRAEILAHWNKRIYPGTCEYLAGLLHRIRTGRFSIAAYYAEIEHSKQLLAQRAHPL